MIADAFNVKDRQVIISMESFLLEKVFSLDVSIPTRLDFAERFVLCGKLSVKEELMVKFLIELSYFDFNLFYYPASLTAAGAIHLTLQVKYYYVININNMINVNSYYVLQILNYGQKI